SVQFGNFRCRKEFHTFADGTFLILFKNKTCCKWSGRFFIFSENGKKKACINTKINTKNSPSNGHNLGTTFFGGFPDRFTFGLEKTQQWNDSAKIVQRRFHQYCRLDADGHFTHNSNKNASRKNRSKPF